MAAADARHLSHNEATAARCLHGSLNNPRLLNATLHRLSRPAWHQAVAHQAWRHLWLRRTTATLPYHMHTHHCSVLYQHTILDFSYIMCMTISNCVALGRPEMTILCCATADASPICHWEVSLPQTSYRFFTSKLSRGAISFTARHSHGNHTFPKLV